MDTKDLQTLELSAVLDQLANRAAFSASKELARTLFPSDDIEQVSRRLAETTEARLLLNIKTDLTIGGAHDIRSMAEAASRGSVLEASELLDVKSTLIAARTMGRHLEKEDESYPELSRIALDLHPAPGLIDRISKAVDDHGEVVDGASDSLGEIRRDLRHAHDRLTSKLQRLISNPKIVPILQEPIITQRDGRFVIPLRAEFKGRLKSVIHDQSASGATLFVEPLQVVEFNNKVRELELAERDEIRRILAELSRLVGEQSETIGNTVDALARMDLAFAKARYAETLQANEPILRRFEPRSGGKHPGSTLKLIQARHPFLDPESVVPVDLVLDPGTYVLVITGPNTGGKTVTLKTAGLLVLMAECGLHIPVASGSELSLFDMIYADIGDEQSIEQSLSTFSAHISNIIRILAKAGDKSLVVLDELGAGTDPQEGAALAQALLQEFLDRRVTTIVATHFSALKIFAHNTTAVRNASVEFDVESLLPTYHLTIGLPGRSNALAIAGRLGLDEKIIEDARSMVSPEDLTADTLLDEIHKERDLARAIRIEAEEEQEKGKQLQVELRRRINEIETERQELRQQAREEALEELDAVREEIALLRRRLEVAGQSLEELDTVEAGLESLVEDLEESVAQPEPDLKIPHRPIRLGDRVYLRTLDAEGVVTELGESKAEVQIGRLRVRAGLNELSLNKDSGPGKKEKEKRMEATRISAQPSPVPPMELHLRGQTVDEALDVLEQRLDAAYLAGLPFIRVVHGKGTGKLRKAIRAALRGNRYVASFEPGSAGEGGEGVTVIRLNS
ncbi:MAG: endonuclease MutS2 [Anaerolineales bacterium]